MGRTSDKCMCNSLALFSVQCGGMTGLTFSVSPLLDPDLHSVWDNALIAKAIRLTPAKYSKPIHAPALKSSLHGTIYNPYVHRIYWEGLGADQQSRRWGSEADLWLSCPPAPSFEFVPTQPLEPQLQEVLVGGAATAPQRKPRVGSGLPTTSDLDILCPYAWAAPIQVLNCSIVWPPGLDDPQFAMQSLLMIMHPCCPPCLTHIRSYCQVSCFLPAPLMDRPHCHLYLIISLTTNPRQTLFQPSSRSFIVISPSLSQRSSPIWMRAVSLSRAAHQHEVKKQRRHNGRKRLRTTRRKFPSAPVLLVPAQRVC